MATDLSPRGRQHGSDPDTSSIPISDPDYRDASSLPISTVDPVSDPDYRDAASLPVCADTLEADGDASSGSGYVDGASAKSEALQDSGEAPYVDAISTGSAFYDAEESPGGVAWFVTCTKFVVVHFGVTGWLNW